jgi:hypothetical protein
MKICPRTSRICFLQPSTRILFFPSAPSWLTQSHSPIWWDLLFYDWWDRSSRRVPDQLRKDLSSIIILGFWTLWNLHNLCVFDGEPPPNLARPLLHDCLFRILVGCVVHVQGFLYSIDPCPRYTALLCVREEKDNFRWWLFTKVGEDLFPISYWSTKKIYG